MLLLSFSKGEDKYKIYMQREGEISLSILSVGSFTSERDTQVIRVNCPTRYFYLS